MNRRQFLLGCVAAAVLKPSLALSDTIVAEGSALSTYDAGMGGWLYSDTMAVMLRKQLQGLSRIISYDEAREIAGLPQCGIGSRNAWCFGAIGEGSNGACR